MAAIVTACVTDPVKACITEPAKAVGKWFTEQTSEQITFLCCFTSIITGLKEEFQKLKDDTAELNREVGTGQDNSETPVPRVTTWLTNSNNLIVEINGILNEAEKLGSGVSELGDRYSLSKSAKKTTEGTQKLRGEKPKVEFLPRPKAASQEVELGKTFKCVSRNEIEEAIMKTLRDGDKNMIGICGMGGLGKTTMATKIMNRALNEHIFDEVVIVTFSQKVNISNIQDEIGDQLGLKKLKEETLQSARARLLHARLSDEKTTTLLVLDDVWKKPALQSIGIPRDSKWCKIIFTSRNSDVLLKMGVQIFPMEVLSKEEAWSFFKERAGTCVDDPDLNPLATQIAKECGGLPINLAAVGAVLKDKPIQRIWRDLLRKLKENVPDNVEYDEENYTPLKLSYEYLDSEEAQFIFLLCCLFPEDADIPLEYLTYFCMGLGGIFEHNITNMGKATDKMCTLTEFLKDRSLLLESNKKECVRMHDVVRDVCTSIAKEKGYIGKDGSTWISSSHLVGEGNVLLSGSGCPNLNLLFLDSTYDESLGFKFRDAFLEGMRQLYVLCIQNYSSLTTLPYPTHTLGKLTTLIIESCKELETISVVGELVNLEILICRDCDSIEELPSEMKGLKSLKVLELTRCWKLKSIGRDFISSLEGLEELKMYLSFNRWEAEESEERENASIKELEKLTNLSCLEIEIYDDSLLSENIALSTDKIVRFIIRTTFKMYGSFQSEFSKELSFRLRKEARVGDWIEKLFLRAEYLDLRGDGANNVGLAKIRQNIRWLQLLECESMKNLVEASGADDATEPTVFPSLEHLQLYSLPELQEICDGPISSTSFHKLKELHLSELRALTQLSKSSNVPHFTNLSSIVIRSCHSLRNLGQLSMAGKYCLPQLEKLGISFCSKMEQVFVLNNQEVITKVFPKLMKVKLFKLPNLTTLFQGIQAIEFPLLRELEIRECSKMKSIIRSNSQNIDDSLFLLICQPQKVSLSCLEVLSIDHIGSKSIFTLSTAANLVSLRELSITECHWVVNVIRDEEEKKEDGGVVGGGGEIRTVVFPKLEEIYLRDLPKLVRFCEWKCDVEFPSLRNVKIGKCCNMEKFSMGSVAVPNFETLQVDYHGHIVFAKDDLNGALHQLYLGCPEKVPFVLVPLSLCNRFETLTINKYAGSMNFFTFSVAANLVNLRELRIENCDEMIKVIEGEEQQERILLFPKLEELYLRNLPKLVTFCEVKFASLMNRLFKKVMCECSKCDVQLPSLTKMDIWECPDMESFSMGLAVATPKLEALTTDLTTYVGVGVEVAFHSLKELKISGNENPFDDDKISVSLFSGLEELEFFSCKCSMSLLSSSAVGNLVNLRLLKINDSYDMLVNVIKEEEEDGKVVVSGGETITSDVIFPKLEELHLYELPKLVRFCEWKCDVELPSLTKLEIWRCPNIKSFSMGFVAAPNLKMVQIIDEEEIDATEDLNGALQQHYLARQEKKKKLTPAIKDLKGAQQQQHYLAHQQKGNEEGESSHVKDEIEEEDDDN